MAEAVLTGTVVVDSTAQEVWDYLTDWRRQGEWIPLTTVEPVGDPKARPGARIRAYTGVGPLRFADPITVTHC